MAATELIDKIFERLDEVGITVTHLAQKLQMERTAVYAKRRSIKANKRDEFAEQIMEAFPDQFRDWKVPTSPEIQKPEEAKLENRYIEVLERYNEDLRAEKQMLIEENKKLVEALKRENETLIAELKKMIEDFRQHVS